MSEKNKIKECFVIMPISNNSNYSDGHFTRVYNYLIVPACELAGFKAIRADEVLNTNFIALDIVKKIIESDMAVCDLSSLNPNVLYELGIRQAFNKPVTLIKDQVTKRIFDIQSFRDFNYDSNLRIDNVENEIKELSEMILNTYNSKGTEINSLITLLSISPAKLVENTKISTESELILNSLANLDRRISDFENNKLTRGRDFYNSKGQIENKLPMYTVVPNEYKIGSQLTNTEIENLQSGDFIYHDRFGVGEIIQISQINNDSQKIKAIIKFNSGLKSILVSSSTLKRVLN